MDDLQFELVTPWGEAYRFGYGLPVRIVANGGFDPASASIRTQDTDNPVASGRLFGQDRFGGMKWGFTGFVNHDDPTAALAELRTLERIWQRERDVGDIDILRYQLAGDGGRVRRVWGRARRFARTLDNRFLLGNIPFVSDFDTSDANTYEEEERSASITVAAPSISGFPVPFTPPWTSLSHGVRQGVLSNVGGDQPAPFVLTLTGDLQAGARILGEKWKIVLGKNLELGQTLVVDTRPWSMSMTLNGDPVSGYLAPSTSRLYDARLDPAGDSIAIDGLSPSGTASATVRWRAASSSI